MNWNEFVGGLVTRLFGDLGIALFALLPLLIIGFILNRRRTRYHARASEPFTEMPLRPPGESLRLKIEELTDEFDTAFSKASLAGMGAFCLIFAAPPNQQARVALGAGIAVSIAYIYTGRTMFRVQKELWSYRLGFAGERATGEVVNQLLADGFQVFHDVPFDKMGRKYNIDHVLVGPPGVYAVETKTHRKPTDIRGLPKATVYSNGEILEFPKYNDAKAILQARRNAKALAVWLTKATGEHIEVGAILTLPGWDVQRTKPGDVNVLRPDEIKRSFPAQPKQPLDSKQIGRIAHQLTERCRLANPG